MNKIQELKMKIAELNLQILQIQEECSHPKGAVIKKAGSNTGNYDPSHDCYWYDFYCTLCEKSWTEEQ